MVLQLSQGISYGAIKYESLSYGETTAFPLEKDLHGLMTEVYDKALTERKIAFIHQWINDKDEIFAKDAKHILDIFKETLNPYIDGLELKEKGGLFHFPPSMMNYVIKNQNIEYSIAFRMTNDLKYLLARPMLNCPFPQNSNINSILVEGLSMLENYRRVISACMFNKEPGEMYEQVYVTPWAHNYYTKPLRKEDIPLVLKECSETMQSLEPYSAEIYQAALLVAFLDGGKKEAKALEERLQKTPFPKILQPIKEDIQRQIKEHLGKIHLKETPTLNKYLL